MEKKYAILIPSYNSSKADVLKSFATLPKNSDIFVVDDGSIVPFKEIIGNELSCFTNLEIIVSKKNIGIENALNLGLSKILKEYEYVARLDIGDVSRLDRFDLQIKYMDENPDVSILGSWAEFITPEGQTLFINKTPISNKDILNKMFVNNAFMHPSVVMRCSTLLNAGVYSDKYQACEDYDLFFRLLKFGKGHNIPEVLIKYEVNFTSISSKKRRVQVFNRLKIILKNFTYFHNGLYPYYGVLRAIIFLFINRRTTTLIRKIIRK